MKLKTVNIKGKEYVKVEERLKAFRELYKDWSLLSEIIEISEERTIIKAIIKDENRRVIAHGTACEYRDSSHINKTSMVENCETSAWGRALGNLGIGIDTAICSADELENALEGQERITAHKPMLGTDIYDDKRKDHIEMLFKVCKQKGLSKDEAKIISEQLKDCSVMVKEVSDFVGEFKSH